MDLFLSWSGELSKQLAIELHKWLPLVINGIKPFVSSENIEKGKIWERQIFDKLANSSYGIICLTKENIVSPWVMFEAGALYNNISNSKVSCVLFDNLSCNDIRGPLSMFQNTEFNKIEMLKLLTSINNDIKEWKLSESILNKSFEKWYPDLEKRVRKTHNRYSKMSSNLNENNSELNSLHELTNNISNAISNSQIKIATDSVDFIHFINEQTLAFSEKSNNHPVKIRINPVNDKDNILKDISIDNNGIHIEKSTGCGGKGVAIDILFYSEFDLLWMLSFQFHKGDTFVTTKNLEVPTNEFEKLRYNTIWRS
jgi:hypothetical protein